MTRSSVKILLSFCAVVVLASSCNDSNRSGGTACTGFQVACPTATGASVCTPVSSDPNNCGSCGNVCALGQTCSVGMCTGTALDGSVDAARDGGSSGTCSPSCASQQRCCGSSCVNRSVTAGTNGREDSSFENCNGCGLSCDATRASACASAGGGAPRCVCGNSDACTGSRECVVSGSTFACVDMMTDPNNCGAVGHACGAEELCTAGTCTCGTSGIACGVGTTCCGGSCIDTSADDANCGGCDIACGAGSTCSDSMCRCGTEVCTPGSESSLGEICCDSHCVANNDEHCGACDTVCDTGSMLSCVFGADLVGGGASHICCGIDLGGLGGGGLPGGGLPTGPICGDFGGGGIPGLP